MSIDFGALLPVIERIVRYRCRDEDRVADALGWAWVLYQRAEQCGRVDRVYATPLAQQALRWARDRHLGCPRNNRDITTRRGVAREPMAEVGDRRPAVSVELHDWMGALPTRLRRIAVLLAEGHTGQEVAALVGVTPRRVSQLRRDLHDLWHDVE